MEWKLDFSKSVTLVYYYVKLVGLAPFVLKNNRFYLPNLLSKIYPVILAFGYSILFSVIMVSNSKVTNDDLTENRKLWNIIKHAVNCVVVFLIVIVCTCMRKRIIHFMNELCFVSNELDRIGIEENRSKILKIFITMSAVANVIYLITSFIPPIQIDIYWFESVIKDGIRVCVVSIFVQILHCVKKRFRFINEKLYREVETHYEASSLNSRNLVTANNPRYNHRAQSKKLAIILRIRKLETLHLKLCGVVKQMIHVFAVSIFLYYIESTFILVISCNWACYIYSAIDEPNIMEKLLFMVKNHSRVILIISTIITEMLFMANAYSTTCQQANAIKVVLAKAWIKFKPEDLEDELIMLNLHLLLKPLATSLFGVFDMDYSFVYKVICSVTSYLIITQQYKAELIGVIQPLNSTSVE